jgi:phage gpG-like protein
MSPEEGMEKMYGIAEVYKELPQIINDMIARNFAAGKNPDGSDWEDLSDTTKDLRFEQGIAKFNPRKANAFNEVLKASGDYFDDLKDIELAAFRTGSQIDIEGKQIYSFYHLSTANLPSLWNEFSHKASGAIPSKATVPQRSVVYFDKEAELQILRMIEKSIENYWR